MAHITKKSDKLNFWSVTALVIGSQIGSGILVLPSSLAQYGFLAIWGWVLASFGAIALACVFANLSSWIPRTGGASRYIEVAFGRKTAFFVGWTYWVISWASTIVVIKACVAYLAPILGKHSSVENLVIEVGIMLFIISINLRGLRTAGLIEVILTSLKIFTFLAVPIIGICFFDSKNFVQSEVVLEQGLALNISKVLLLTMWGFIGLETGTTPASSVDNPSKIIPRATIFGTVCVAVLYLLNNIVVMGVVPGSELAMSSAPYAAAAQIILGPNWYVGISLISAIIFIGTANSWSLASSQIALGLAEDGLMPKFFASKNRFGSPYISILISCGCIIPGLALTMSDSIAAEIERVMDLSVVAFLCIYVSCIIAFFKISIGRGKVDVWSFIAGIVAFFVCGFIICKSSLQGLMFTAFFVISGFPVYIWMQKQDRKITTPLS